MIFSLCLGVTLTAFIVISWPALQMVGVLVKAGGLLWLLLPSSALAFPLFCLMFYGDTTHQIPFAMLPAVPFILLLARAALRPYKDRKILAPAIPALLTCLLATANGYWLENGWIQPFVGSVLALLVVLVPRHEAWRKELEAGAVVAVVLMFATLWVFATFYADASIGVCRRDKCSLLGSVLQAGASGNAIGLMMVASIPFCVLALPFFRGNLAAICILIPIDLSAGRTSLLAGAFVVVVSVASRMRYVPRLRALAFPVGIVAFLTAMAISLMPALRTYDAGAYTTRGGLWIRAKELIAAKPLFGYGPGYWTRQEESWMTASTYGVHNVWLESLVGVGFVGTLLLMLSLVWMVKAAGPSRFAGIALLSPIFASGFTEVTLTPYLPSIAYASLPIFLVFLTASQSGESRAGSKPEIGAVEMAPQPRLYVNSGQHYRRRDGADGKLHPTLSCDWCNRTEGSTSTTVRDRDPSTSTSV